MQRFPFLGKARSSEQPESPEPEVKTISIGSFSAESIGLDLPANWQPHTFRSIPKHTEYSLVDDEGQVVIRAVSRQSSSGLIRKLALDLETHPHLCWRWKVDQPVQRCDLDAKTGDACSARVFVTFGKILTSLRAINYVWATGKAIGESLVSPVSDRVKLVVLQNETSPLQTWIEEERDVYADYCQLFGAPPPRTSGFALMTDTYRTQEEAIAFYGDIHLHGRG
jgi:hypothetical protein